MVPACMQYLKFKYALPIGNSCLAATTNPRLPLPFHRIKEHSAPAFAPHQSEASAGMSADTRLFGSSIGAANKQRPQMQVIIRVLVINFMSNSPRSAFDLVVSRRPSYPPDPHLSSPKQVRRHDLLVDPPCNLEENADVSGTPRFYIQTFPVSYLNLERAIA
jgi:hypothetical protein